MSTRRDKEEGLKEAEQGISTLLWCIGESPEREGLQKTPYRFVKAFREMTAGYSEDPEKILSTQFDAESYDEMVILKDIEFKSLCEHHLLPFSGKAHFGYIPDEKIVGLSKIARLVECFSRRLQVQERLTHQITGTFSDIMKPLGCGVVVEAHHSCMSCRGVKKDNSVMVTSSLTGQMRDAKARAEFLNLIKK